MPTVRRGCWEHASSIREETFSHNAPLTPSQLSMPPGRQGGRTSASNTIAQGRVGGCQRGWAGTLRTSFFRPVLEALTFATVLAGRPPKSSRRNYWGGWSLNLLVAPPDIDVELWHNLGGQQHAKRRGPRRGAAHKSLQNLRVCKPCLQDSPFGTKAR